MIKLIVFYFVNNSKFAANVKLLGIYRATSFGRYRLIVTVIWSFITVIAQRWCIKKRKHLLREPSIRVSYDNRWMESATCFSLSSWLIVILFVLPFFKFVSIFLGVALRPRCYLSVINGNPSTPLRIAQRHCWTIVLWNGYEEGNLSPCRN